MGASGRLFLVSNPQEMDDVELALSVDIWWPVLCIQGVTLFCDK